jgi:hypothetical protein
MKFKLTFKQEKNMKFKFYFLVMCFSPSIIFGVSNKVLIKRNEQFIQDMVKYNNTLTPKKIYEKSEEYRERKEKIIKDIFPDTSYLYI